MMELQEPSTSAKRKRVESDFGMPTNEYVLKVTKELYLDKATADVYFQCGPERKRIPAHKNILSKASDVFELQFFGDMTKDQEETKKVNLILDFLKYCGENDMIGKMENSTDMMNHLAREYVKKVGKEEKGEEEVETKREKHTENDIILSTTSSEAFKIFLQFIYRTDVELNIEYITEK